MDEKLAHYIDLWTLSQPQLLATTPTSHVYTVEHEGETVVLKLLTEYGWEERAGAIALRCYGGHGAVRLYQADEQAQLLEYVAGGDLVSLVERGSEGDAEATHFIAGVLRQLHAAPQPEPYPNGLFRLERWFQELFKKAKADINAGDESVFVRGAKLARTLLDDPRDVRVLHGDIHHANIRHAERGWLAFDPKGLVGERTYDCANTLCNPFLGQQSFDPHVHDEARLLRNAGILADELGIALERVLAFTFAYSCLSASWSLTNGVEGEGAAEWAINIARIVEPHVDMPTP